MNDSITAWVRTVVPACWSAAIAWLVSLGLPDAVTTATAGLGNTVIVPIVLGVVYASLRKIEPFLPAWLTRILLGSDKPPTYSR